MSDISRFSLTIIIPAWPDEVRPFALDYIDKLDSLKEDLEVLISHGLSPCRQRNEAAKQATEEVLVFFDNDSCPEIDYFKQLSPHFKDPSVVGVGGPNPALETDHFIPNVVEGIFTNPFVIFSKVSRYKPTGKMRDSKDSDLIFCNFAMRKSTYLELNGLDERLCPNEENEFFERFRVKYPDKKLLYDPELIAYEPRPDTWKAFFKKMFGYGRGRARQFKIRPTFWSGLHMSICLGFFSPLLLYFKFGRSLLGFAGSFYLLLIVLSSVYAFFLNKRKSVAFMIPLAAFGVHVSYLLGLWKGLFESLNLPNRRNIDVKIEIYSKNKKNQ